MHIISAVDFPLFCSNSARKCLILQAESSPQRSLIVLEILRAEFYFILFFYFISFAVKNTNKKNTEDMQTPVIRTINTLIITERFGQGHRNS